MVNLRRLMGMMVDVVLPPRCLGCGIIVRRHGGYCPKCWGSLHWIHDPRCLLCGVPYPCDYGVSGCYRQMPQTCLGPLMAGRSVFVYNKVSSQMILKLKYSDKTFMVETFGDHLMEALKTFNRTFTLLIPVPLHWRRQWIRKYNQSSLLANALSRRCGVPVAHTVLRRVLPTQPLKGGSFHKRVTALKGAFALSPKAKPILAGQHVVLIDDVWTTGATLQSCAHVLLQGGAKSVSALTMARVLPADLS